jgi:hypothetical protein
VTTFRPRLPGSAPTPADLAERDAFAALTAQSLPSVRTSAETWRNGLTAFITLVTTGIVIKGRDTTADLDLWWRLGVTVLVGTGLLAAVLGLWQTLAAQAGTHPGPITLADIHRDFGSVAAYQVALADGAAVRIRRARLLVGLALGLLIGGITVTWWAPTASSKPPAFLEVTQKDATTCGELSSADGGRLRLKVAGVHDVVSIPVTDIVNIKVVAKCG